MTDEEVMRYIDITVKKTISEYRSNGLIKEMDSAAYTDASAILKDYYKNNKSDTSITYAIQGQRFDPYFCIISLYYEQGKTIEQIAEHLDVDVSTITRNKKRLCLAIYENII